MRIGSNTFRLEAPKISREKLGAGYAQRAVNCRVLSGALEPWKSNRTETPGITKTGTIRSLHLMDADASDGGPYPLQWTAIVSAVRALRPSDTSDLTYYTGDGAPKVTNRTLATTGTQDTSGYPKGWYLLGVPAPTDTPIAKVSQSTDPQGSLPLDNPDAEDGTNNWTIDTSVDPDGELLTSATDPYVGNYSFEAGDAAITHAYQTLDMSSLGLIVGQNLKIVYGQKSDSADATTGATAEMRLEFYDNSASKISEYVPGQTSTGGVWTTRTHDGITIPDDTVEIRLVQRYERTGTGPGALDAYIDGIRLIAGDTSFHSSGESLSEWLVSGQSSVVVFSDQYYDLNMAPGVFRFNTDGSKPVSIYRNFVSGSSPSYTIQWEYTTHEAAYCVVVLDSDAAGFSTQLRFDDTGVYLEQTGGWGSTYSSSTKIATASYWRFTNSDNVWWRGFITVTANSSTKKTGTVRAIRLDNGQEMLAETSFDFDVTGDYIGFKVWRDLGFLREIYINITPGSSASDATVSEYTEYVSTYVSDTFGGLAISAPSPASKQVLLGLNPSITVTTATTLPAGYEDYGITGKLIWRAVTGSDGTVLRLVTPTPIAIATADYLDTKLDSALEDDVLDTEGWSPPPADAHSIVVGANGITYVASKNQVFPSPVNQPHAYPPLWAVPLTTDYAIVGLATIAADVYALTQAHPYVITGTDPSALSMERLAKPLGCVSEQSIAVSERVGVVYASSDGLAYCNRADVGLLTDTLLSEREWQAFKPESINGTVYEGYYIGFYDTGTEQGGFIIDLSNGNAGLGRLDFYASAIWLNPITGNLHMVVGGEHVTFNTGDDLMSFDWWSSLTLVDRPTSFERGRVELGEGTGAATMKLYYDDTLVATNDRSSSQEFLLPAKVAQESAYFTLSGSRKVRRAMVAESLEELRWA